MYLLTVRRVTWEFLADNIFDRYSKIIVIQTLMKITIEIPPDYYEGDWISEDGETSPPDTNKARQVRCVAETNWEEFAYEMADIIDTELKKMAAKYQKDKLLLGIKDQQMVEP